MEITYFCGSALQCISTPCAAAVVYTANITCLLVIEDIHILSAPSCDVLKAVEITGISSKAGLKVTDFVATPLDETVKDSIPLCA
ncbi:hypothetical protein [Faecalicatena contorta]|uniref:hypothetical protein n=1 Tax=Faecalicatena contorta TaxID=39482 RepID=UPI001F20404C|nr:hypothetical protein [Faecalicatena contorta]MCF2555743.1 hypothetical protein [Faecalicatena contorta]